MGQFSTGPVTMAALAIFILFTIFVLPAQAAQGSNEMNHAGTPDLSFYYTAGGLYRMAEAYGPAGRAAYLRVRWTFDLIWPMVYTFFLVTCIGWLSGRVVPPDSLWRLANLAPVIGALLDYLENASTSLVMARYPLSTPLVDALAPIFTLFKWIFVGGSFVLILAGLLSAVWRFGKRVAAN
jgi:hypothetical protein